MEKKKTRTQLYRINIIHILIIITLITFITEIIVYLDLNLSGRLSVTPMNYLIRYIIIPDAVNIISIIVALWVDYSESFSEKIKNYSPVVAAGFMSLGIASSHNFFITSLCGTLIPVILVSVYGDRKMIRNITIMSYVFLAIATIIAKYDSQKTYKYLYIDSVVIGIIMAAAYLCGITTVNLVKENFEEIEERILKEQLLTEQLLHDQLTGLYNHTAFYRCLEKEIEECEKAKKKLSLAVIDIDNFKRVNDIYGHENGNIVLIHLAQYMKEICEDSSVVCRYGGEEFAVIFPNTDREKAKEIMETVRRRFERHNYMFMPQHHVTISCGICEVDLNNLDKADELFKKADEIMYQAKNSGKNQVIAI